MRSVIFCEVIPFIEKEKRKQPKRQKDRSTQTAKRQAYKNGGQGLNPPNQESGKHTVTTKIKSKKKPENKNQNQRYSVFICSRNIPSSAS